MSSPIIEPKVGVFMLLVAAAAYVTLGVVVSCGVPPLEHANNVAEGASFANELRQCREKGRAAKADGGGAEGYMQAYEACADAYENAHKVKR